MGIFGNVKRNWNDGSLMAGLQSAGAIVQGDYGTAAQIQGLHRQQQDEQRQADAKARQIEAEVQALMARGVPEQEARIIAQGGGADAYLAQQNAPQAPNEFERTLRAAGIDPASPQGQDLYRQRAATMASPAPQMTGSPETGYRWNTPPPPQIPGLTSPQQQAPQQQGGQVINTEMFRGAVNGLGAQGAADWLQRNNVIVAVRTPQEASQLPSGTRIRLPDGTIGRVP